jgi:SAM-dependent methyltransferase
VKLKDATALIEGGVDARAPEVWADLGCGDGTFTLALASLLGDGSTIHAVDTDASALRRVPDRHANVSIVTHVHDFTRQPWPFDDVDGILMANALHFVQSQAAFIRACAPSLRQPRFLIVEYDTDVANPWVPYPLSRASAERLFAGNGYPSITTLGTRPSRYHRSRIYALIARGSALQADGDVDFGRRRSYRE